MHTLAVWHDFPEPTPESEVVITFCESTSCLMTDLLLLHTASAWALTGLIWTIQLVHYPLFAEVAEARFRAFEESHQWRITLIVAPLMLAELGTAVLLLWLGYADRWFVAALFPLALIWLSTAMIQVPLHNQLARGFDTQAHRKLVRSNWLRTLSWSARGLLLLVCLRGIPSVT